MKKLFLMMAAFLGATAVASAADLPIPAPVAMPIPVLFSWSGCYIGIEGGANWGHSEQAAQSGPFGTDRSMTGIYNLSGGIAGGTLGCNVQLSNFVVGIENDYSWTNKRGSALTLPPFDTTATNTTRENWIDTLRGRFGWTPVERFMVYVTGGVAWAGTHLDVSSPTIGVVTDSRVRVGWTAGAGGEWAAWSGPLGDLTVKLEYLHAGFEANTYFNAPITVAGVAIISRDVRLSDDMVRAGVNLKFNWGNPVVARY
jgi:outer membrane immunogenic protein